MSVDFVDLVYVCAFIICNKEQNETQHREVKLFEKVYVITILFQKLK